MQVIVPSALTLTSTTVAASALAEWSAATAYSIGNQVKVTTTTPHREYEALQSGTNYPPAANPSHWLDLGATNQYRMIDDSVSSQTTATTAIEVVITPPGRFTHVALFGLSNVVQVQCVVTADAVDVFDATWAVSRIDESLAWSDYYFGEGIYGSSLVESVTAAYSDTTVTLTLTGDTGVTVGCGHLVLGVATYLGATLYGADLGIVDYSRKEADTWGNIQLVERAYAQTISARLRVDDSQVDRVASTLARLRATPCVYDCNNTGGAIESLRLFGFYRDFAVLLAGHNDSACELQLEGLT